MRAARVIIALSFLWLSGCVEIQEVRQPAVGQLNTPFETQLDVTSVPFGNCTVATPCNPTMAVSLPAGWVIESCAYAGLVNGTCSPVAGPIPLAAPTSTDASWHAFAGEEVTNATEGSPVSATVTLRIRPTAIGDFVLDYQMNGNGSEIGWGSPSTAHPIAIRAAQPKPTAVPTMSVYGYGLMGLGLAFAALLRRRSRRTNDA